LKKGANQTYAVTKVGVLHVNAAIDANPTLASAKASTIANVSVANTYVKSGVFAVGSYFGWTRQPKPSKEE
jgi:hypothetical protein